MSRLTTRLLGLAATLALLGIVVGLPVLLVAIHTTPAPSSFAWTELTSPDDGTLAVAVIGLVAWIAWAVFTVAIVADLLARTRGHRPRRLRGLEVPQLAASRLVGVAALLFLSVPTVTAIVAGPRAVAVAPQTPPPSAVAQVAPTTDPIAPRAPTPVADPAPPSTSEQHTQPYTVKRGDSLWKIAKDHLGDGTRYVELAKLNHGVLHGEPDFLTPGTVLRIPVQPHSEAHEDAKVARQSTTPARADTSYVVQPGDTLSGIAEAQLGDAATDRRIFEASTAIRQPDGEHLTDPDVIRPGWRLTIPDDTPTRQHEAPRHRQALSRPVSTPPTPLEPPEPPASNTDLPPTLQHGSTDRSTDRSTDLSTDTADTATNGHELPGWVLPGLAGAGAALAGSLLLVLRQHRRTQLRYRTPGHFIAPPPTASRRTEKSAQASGSLLAPPIECLDAALRQLAATTTPTPTVVTVDLDSAAITVRLLQAADLPQPWQGESRTWRIQLSDVPADQLGDVAPYPLLVSVGARDQGTLVFINLEVLATTGLTGDPDRTAALARHIAAELSLNPWSTLVEIHTLGIGSELADIDPSRLHHHTRDDTAFLDQLANDLEAEDPALEPDQYRTLIAASGAGDDGIRRVAKTITSYPGRAAAAILTIDTEPCDHDVELHLTDTGRLTIDRLGLDLNAAGLTAEEAHGCAALVDITRDTHDSPPPPSPDPEACADATGALTADLTMARPTDGPAGDTSLLPLATKDYQATAAALADDLESLAPLASPDAAARVAEQDPDLDEDLARWQASSLVGPKLTLLGPVAARTIGDSRQTAHRRPYYVELLAFLVLHPGGATADEVSDALGIRPERARRDLGVLRGWLGRDPHTGSQYLPNARQSHTGGVKATYIVQGVATDLDLFRRLRTRGQSRGAHGIDDLRTALSLVTGEPFSDLRPTGWGWLLDGDRHDHLMSSAIVDTGHIVTTHALATEDLDLARFSAQATYRAAPYDETSRLDVIAVAVALGHDEDAERLLIDGVLSRSDDDLGPTETPDRTEQLLRQCGWATDRQARNSG